MVFEFKTAGETTLIEAFATFLGSHVQNGKIDVPEHIGKGYIQGYMLGSSLRLMIHRYILKENLLFRRLAVEEPEYDITFTFHAVLPPSKDKKNSNFSPESNYNRFPSVQITSANIDYETLFPANSSINTLIIVIQLSDLKNLLLENEEHQLLQNILSAYRPYFYEEIVSPKMQDVAAEIVGSAIPSELNHFFHSLKAKELIYLFFIELLKRQDLRSYPLNTADVKLAYRIKDKIISDLSITPKLAELALFSGMSESKLKRLFKQIFGNSIYNYYQALRIKEAAYLIKEQKLSVSEAGYKLGFTNLSHFTRLFERYMGLKPKKYSATQ